MQLTLWVALIRAESHNKTLWLTCLDVGYWAVTFGTLGAVLLLAVLNVTTTIVVGSVYLPVIVYGTFVIAELYCNQLTFFVALSSEFMVLFTAESL